MTYVHIAHDCQIGDHVILASYTGLSGHVTIDDYAILEGKVAAQQFVHQQVRYSGPTKSSYLP